MRGIFDFTFPVTASLSCLRKYICLGLSVNCVEGFLWELYTGLPCAAGDTLLAFTNATKTLASWPALGNASRYRRAGDRKGGFYAVVVSGADTEFRRAEA